MFLGDHQHTLDAKGRVSLPRKFRDLLGERIVVAKGLDECLYVYPAKDYEEFMEGLLSRSEFAGDARSVRRFFAGGATETKVDGAGRVALSAGHRAYAGLDKEVAVIGNGDRIELWNAARWAEYINDTTANIDSLTSGLGDKSLP